MSQESCDWAGQRPRVGPPDCKAFSYQWKEKGTSPRFSYSPLGAVEVLRAKWPLTLERGEGHQTLTLLGFLYPVVFRRQQVPFSTFVLHLSTSPVTTTSDRNHTDLITFSFGASAPRFYPLSQYQLPRL